MNNQSQIPYTIVVPARNEEETIGDVLRAVGDMTDDLIVVDGHSSDRTAAISQEYGARVFQDNGRGKGDAIRVGLAFARRPITVFIDADGSHDPEDIPRLVEPIATGKADLALGSRMLGGSEELFGSISEVIRLMGSLVISLSINYRFGVRFTDYQNGFRAIRTDVGKAIGLTSNITTIEQEMAIKCLRNGYRVIERPTHEFRRRAGVSKINVMRTAPVYVWNLISELVRWRKSQGKEVAAVSNQAWLNKELLSEAGLSSNSKLACPSCGCVGERVAVKKRRDLRLCRCNSCGFVQQFDPPATELETLYGHDYYETWGIRQNPDHVWRMKLKSCLMYLDCLAEYPPDGLRRPRLLDIGCAHGFMLEAARKRGFEAVGVEISPAASAARARGFTVYDRPLEEINVPGGTFDVITAIDVIEHVPDVMKFTVELYRILKPGGVLLIVTPDVGSSVAKIMKNAWPHYKQEHIFYFTKRSLSMLLRRSGLTVRSIRCGRKYITFDYALGLFRKYTPGALTFFLACIDDALPSFFKNIPVCLPTEMIAIAQRQASAEAVVRSTAGRTSISGTDNLIPENVYSQT